jgi:hypothetical protein
MINIMNDIKNHYVYYSYEQFGRGYIGYRKCPEGLTPETDTYLGSYHDKGFKPTEKVILFQDLTKQTAIEIEIKLHAFYDIDKNSHFANKAKQTSRGFSWNPTGMMRINNGIIEKYIPQGEEIPEGYTMGNLKETKRKQSEAQKGKKQSKETKLKKSKANKGRIRINNGEREKVILPGKEIPGGFNLGVLEETKRKNSESQKGEKSHIYGKKCYNNGTKQKFFSIEEEIPKDYIKGSKLSGEKNPSYGKSIYNNGIREKFISTSDVIPLGFILGRLPASEETRIKNSKAQNSINSKNKIRVITSSCCYFSVKDTILVLGISKNKFYKLFEKDSITGFYIEK